MKKIIVLSVFILLSINSMAIYHNIMSLLVFINV